ncbi:UNVERIFIED_CONTAM: hypothetical protein Slati_1892000 [Sesamum latifolium]|uniref:Uncharacterized protein n=1 Tax=Sesamum latifolium TaxID=2727402 RepID=A0AAW2X6B0_9LAMI
MGKSGGIYKRSRWRFSSGQMEALSALCDTFLPAVDVDNYEDGRQLQPSLHPQFYQTSASMAGTQHHVINYYYS